MSPKQKRHTAEFKAKIAPEVVREEVTTAELSEKHQMHAAFAAQLNQRNTHQPVHHAAFWVSSSHRKQTTPLQLRCSSASSAR